MRLGKAIQVNLVALLSTFAIFAGMKTFSIVILLALLTLPGCHRDDECDAVRMAVLRGPSAVSALGLMEGTDSVAGVPLRVELMGNPLQVQAALMQGEVDFAVLPTVMAANLYNKGVPVRMLACPVWGTLYIMSSDTAVHRLADLAGGEVAVFGRGATADVLLQSLVERAGGPCRVDYRFTTNAEVAQALRAGQVRAAVVSEPLASLLLAEEGNVHLVQPLDLGGAGEEASAEGFVQAAFVVRAEWAEAHPQLVAPVCEAYRASCDQVSTCPERTARLMVERGLASTEEAARRSLPLCRVRYVEASAIGTELRRYLQLMLDANAASIGGRLPGGDFVMMPPAPEEKEDK